jgi:hypothetical protein
MGSRKQKARPPARRGALVLAAALLAACAPGEPAPPKAAPPAARRELFLLFSANAPRDAPGVFRDYLRRGDYVRLESLPRAARAVVPRRRRYVLPTTLRERWAGEPGLRHWIRRGCAPHTAGTIVYDPEHWVLTPPREQDTIAHSIRTAARLVHATGCHRFGIAPEAGFMFGMSPEACTYSSTRARYREVPWEHVAIVDIQAQRLVGDHCWDDLGIDDYEAVIATIASFVRAHNPRASVVAQLSLRHTPPARMRAAIAAVADIVDGVFISYPSNNLETPCRYCSPANLHAVLAYLRGGT